MFGYVQYDKPHLYIKDMELYQAVYCGTCKSIAKACGQIARFGLSYDVTFLNLLLHNLKNTDVTIEKQSCFTKGIKKKPMSLVDDLSLGVGAFNTILLYYKLTDDMEDEKKGGIRRAFFSGAYRRAKKRYPALDEIVSRQMKEQAKTEKTGTGNVDLAAEATAQMMREVSSYFLEGYATQETEGLFYDIGKWIYLIDAADDYEKDVKRKNYNPFYCAFGAADKATLLAGHEKDLRFIFDTIFYDIRERMSKIRFYFNRDLTDNVLMRGLPAKTQEVLFCSDCKTKKNPRKALPPIGRTVKPKGEQVNE